MEFTPVLEHFVELSVSVAERLHFLVVRRQLCLVLLHGALHGLEVLDVALVVLLQLLQLLLVALVDAVGALELAQLDGELQVALLNTYK